MRKTTSLLAAGGLVLGASAPAQSEELGAGWSLSSSVTITSNYIFRGVPESNEDPSIQGGFEAGHETGAYLGTWAASLSNEGPALELDAYGGYSFDLTDTIWADVGLYYYGYPEPDGEPSNDLDTVELYGGVGSSIGEVAYDVYLHASDDYFGSDEESVYAETNWTVPFGEGFYAGAHLGYLVIDSDTNLDGFDGALTLGYTYGSLDLSVTGSYIDTDEAEDADDAGDWDQEQFAFTISRDF